MPPSRYTWPLFFSAALFSTTDTGSTMVEQAKVDLTTFQGLILALQQYWAERGCVIVQPLDM